MIRLQVLGGIDLRDSDGRELRELLVQPKRTALLVYLAIGGTGALHRRDTLLTLFWPESDLEHARGALSQALRYLRQVLGRAVLTTRGSEEIGLNPECFWCDVSAFDAEFEAGRYEEALGYYRSHMLMGFHAATSSAFEDWLSAERSRLLDRATQAAWALAERDVQQRLASSACSWARRALALAQCNEPDLRRFLMSLHQLGDHAGAIRTYAMFAEQLRLQYDIEPAPETQALAAAIARNGDAGGVLRPTVPLETSVTQTRAAHQADRSPERSHAADELVTAPVPLVRSTGEHPSAFTRMPLGRKGIAIFAGLVLLAMTGAVRVMRQRPPAMVAGEAAAVTSEPGIEVDPALSPDGKLLAYAAVDLSAKVLVRPVAGGRVIAIAEDTATPYWGPKWSPDGSTILVQSPGKASLVSPTGGPLREVLRAPGRSLRFVGWSPDGRQLVFVRNDSLFIRALEARDEHFIAYAKQLHSCDWSRRDLIACVVGNPEFGRLLYAFSNIAPSYLAVFPVQGGPPIAVTDSGALHISPAWSSDGNWLYFVSNRQGPRDIYSVRISSRGVPEGEPTKLTTGANAMTIAMGSDGTRLAYSVFTPKVNIWSIPWSTIDVTAAPMAHTSGSQVVEYMKVSRDGQWLYYDSNLRGNADIYRVRTGGGEPQQLTFDRADDFNPDISADGRELTFHSLRSGNRDIFVMPAEGGRAQQVTFTNTHELAPRWSPDGLSLAFNDIDGERIDLAQRTANGTWTQKVFWARGVRPEWSPDGRRLVMMGVPPDRAAIGPSRRPLVIVPLDSGPTHVVYRHVLGDPQPMTPVWSADGSAILFKTTEGGRISFWSISVVGGRPRLLARADSSVRSFSPAWATDGKRFYFPVADHQSDIWVVELRRER